MSHTVVIEPHYLGNLEYFVTLINARELIFEVQDHFVKQTYRNRCYIHSPAGKHMLIVPVSYDNRTRMKDVKIDYSQSWLRDHWGAFYSSYGKAPFFDFFEDEFRSAWDSKPSFLLDLNLQMMTLCLRLLQIDMPHKLTDDFRSSMEKGSLDLRNRILPKISFDQRDLYIPFPYIQNFGSNFVANLSIVDLLMCEGPGALSILRNSMVKT
ncbi:MAG: WbqC family protein [Cyclobacteriaceae bacterium]